MSANPSADEKMTDNALVFRSMEPTDADLELLKKCFDANGSPRSIEHLRWQYLAVPRRKLYVDFAVTTGTPPRLAAAYAVFPLDARIASARRDCVQSIDTLTDAQFRGKGLFLRLAESVYQRCAADGNDFVFGFPNGNSAHGFFKRLGWTALDPFPFMLRPLRTGYFLKRLVAGLRPLAAVLDFALPIPGSRSLPAGRELKDVAEIGEEFGHVWRRFSENVSCAVERDVTYLRWRLRRPGERYSVLGCYNGQELEAYVVTAVRHHSRGSSGALMELVHDPAHENSAWALLTEALRRMRASGCDAVWAWNYDHSPNHALLSRAGFFSLPERLAPIELHAGVRVFRSTAGDPSQRRSWYISLFDSDTN